jgi:sugar diacid utilization regulator
VNEVRLCVESACALGAPEVVPRDGGSALVVPLGTGEHAAFAVFTRREGSDWDHRLTVELQAQASLAIEKARMHERERSLLLQYQRLSELGTELVAAPDAAEVRAQLLARTSEVVGADACFVALLDQGPDAIAVELRQRSHSEERTVALEGGARLATLRLRDEAAPDRSVFDSWSGEVFRAVGPDTGLATWLAEPLPVPGGALGGLFVAWRSPQVQPTPEQSRILSVIAGSAGSALGRFAASMATDSTLRDRLLELEALASLARRIGGLTREAQIADELLAALRRVGKLDGAVYGAVTDSGLEIVRASGLTDDALAELTAFLGELEAQPESTRLGFGDAGSELVFIPMPGAGGRDLFLAGVGPRGADDQRDRVMATLARYGSVALENADLHERQREAIVRLERQQVETADQNSKLERVLSVHETLALAVLEGRGLESVVRSLGRFMDAEMLVLGPQGRELARWPADAAIDWRPELAPRRQPRTVVSRGDDANLLAAPAVVDGETLAWVIARTAARPGDVERAATEYGALLVALDLLRERTAIEVETRLRGGLLEELFGEGVVPDVVAGRALALGHDLGRRSRVFLVESAPADGDAPAPIDPEAFYAPVAACARDWSPNSLVAPRGGAVVVIAAEAPDTGGERRFEDELQAVARAKLPAAALNIAVGTACEEIADYRDSYLAARRGLDLLHLLDRPGEVFSFRVSTLDSMLLQSNRPEVVVKFISRYVEPLDRYDSVHTSELRRTLEVYYESGSKLQEAARRLHVHVSTLRYRLGKAEELLEIDLKDGSAALDLQVALKAARVLALHRG